MNFEGATPRVSVGVKNKDLLPIQDIKTQITKNELMTYEDVTPELFSIINPFNSTSLLLLSGSTPMPTHNLQVHYLQNSTYSLRQRESVSLF